ncbi:hypothetical protein TcasGA2_TC012210 [Tribolium castaneum]|uniref:Uncharacterized protein n=1 Tax=Tribolium castaneum TaxID=7070 RepID=D6X068_TRICA|nr:hypothetical protein TcasGA2_TC012210 [Tribolium castaneum]
MRSLAGNTISLLREVVRRNERANGFEVATVGSAACARFQTEKLLPEESGRDKDGRSQQATVAAKSTGQNQYQWALRPPSLFFRGQVCKQMRRKRAIIPESLVLLQTTTLAKLPTL